MKILAISGSLRAGSFNSRAIKLAQAQAPDGTEVSIADLSQIPVYNEDVYTQGFPPAVEAFREAIREADGLLISTPEYNYSISGVLKNAIDWASRASRDNEPRLAAYQGKYAAIMATSPGGLGGMRGLVFLRLLLGNLGVLVLPDQQAVPNAHQAFGADAALKDEKAQETVMGLGQKLAKVL